jgi:hypothetical protein
MSRKISLVQFEGISGTYLRIEYPDFNRVEYRQLRIRNVGRPANPNWLLIAATKQIASLLVDLLIQIVVG